MTPNSSAKSLAGLTRGTPWEEYDTATSSDHHAVLARSIGTQPTAQASSTKSFFTPSSYPLTRPKAVMRTVNHPVSSQISGYAVANYSHAMLGHYMWCICVMAIISISQLFSADVIINSDNKYFSSSLPIKWAIIESGGKENEMMVTVYDRTNGGYGIGICTLFFDWDGLDPNKYIIGESVEINKIKWVYTKDKKWIGIKSGDKYIATMQLNDGIDASNPIYHSFINSIKVK